MRIESKHLRLVAVACMAAVVLASLAPAAWAGNGKYKSKKYRRDYRPRVVERVVHRPHRVVEVRRYSDGAPAFAGFIGGLALGAILGSNSAHGGPVVVEREYVYVDPYCGERFASLDHFLSHRRHHRHHPRIVRVIEVRSGHCVRTLQWHDGHWEPRDDWDDRRYDDDRYYEDRGGWDR